MQKLKYPLKNIIVSAGYKNPTYLKRFGFAHYGWDMGCHEDRTIYSPGDGTVVACGMDGADSKKRLGNVCVIIFSECVIGNQVMDLVCRMYHMESILVKIGDSVKEGQKIGVYGNTGANTTGPHLHIEFDTDVKYPTYAYGVSSGGKIIKHGTVDSSLNPVNCLYLTKNQDISFPDTQWVTVMEMQTVLKDQELSAKILKTLDDINALQKSLTEVYKFGV